MPVRPSRITILVIATAALVFTGGAYANSFEVTADAAMNGSDYGAEVILAGGDPEKVYVVTKHPDDVSTYNISFLIDPNDLAQDPKSSMDIF